MLRRNIDLALTRERIVLPSQIEAFDLQLARFQIYFCVQTVDVVFEKRQRSALDPKVAAEVTAVGIHRSLDADFAGEISRVRTEKSKEFAQLINRRRNVSAKIRPEPLGRVGG